jgi:hypothetical protein
MHFHVLRINHGLNHGRPAGSGVTMLRTSKGRPAIASARGVSTPLSGLYFASSSLNLLEVLRDCARTRVAAQNNLHMWGRSYR